jgi:hypothetical protein
MPVVLRQAGLRYYFFSNEGSPREPAHVHVRGGGNDAKVWLEPEVAIADSFGFSPAEIWRILWVVGAHRRQFLKAWYEHFSRIG